MTDPELTAYFADRPLPTGHIKFSPFELTDDLAAMVADSLRRMALNDAAASTSRQVLERVVTYLESAKK